MVYDKHGICLAKEEAEELLDLINKLFRLVGIEKAEYPIGTFTISEMLRDIIDVGFE